jgi:hypothetical protein
MKALQVLVLTLGGLAFGCGAQRQGPAGPSPGPDGSAIIVRGSELSGTLLDGLRVRVPTMMVSTQGGGCPNIMFRGPRSIRNQANPSVYVDGTLMVDTCILTQITASDVERVEIFPSGGTSRPGIQRNPFGVIMVFRVRE